MKHHLLMQEFVLSVIKELKNVKQELLGDVNNADFIIVQSVKDIKRMFVQEIMYLNLKKILNQEMMLFVIFVQLLSRRKLYIVTNANLMSVHCALKLKITRKNDLFLNSYFI